jgi:hypothetical protein
VNYTLVEFLLELVVMVSLSTFLIAFALLLRR